MAKSYYIISKTSVSVYKSPGGKKTGTLKKGAVIEGSSVGASAYYKISSVLNGNAYYTGTAMNSYVSTGDCKLDMSTTKEVNPNTNIVGAGSNGVTNTDNGGGGSHSTTNAGAGGEEGTGTEETVYADDAFVIKYSDFKKEEEYINDLSGGLRITNLQGIMGMPHQFLPNTDPRIPLNDTDSSLNFEEDALGIVYSEKIIEPMPLMFMTPGTPSFMSAFSQDQKSTMLGKFLNSITEDDFNSLINENSGKFYSLKYEYVEYFKYVNAMLRSAAYFLGIQDKTINGKKLGTFNWFYSNSSNGTKTSQSNTTETEDGTDAYDNNGLRKFLGTYAGAIPFYVQAETRSTDSFSNSPAASSLASSIDSLSDTARELNFLIGNVSGNIGAGELYDKYISVDAMNTNIDTTSQTINGLLGNGNVLSNILGKAQTLLAGGRMIFPEIWGDSSFSRSYSCSLKLISPSGDKLSIFLNILVPIYHLLAFVLPRASTGQTFYSPFLVRAYYKGIFNIDMGLITDMNIEKGSDGEWTPDGLPTVAEISFTIKDLYDGLPMSTQENEKDIGIMSNITELDYIANSCGINIDEPEIGRTIKMYMGLFTSSITDKFTLDIFGGVTQYINKKVEKIFGIF